MSALIARPRVLQNGTGAVLRLLADKAVEKVTAQDFMTAEQRMNVYLRLGTVDVTAAINAACDAIGAAGAGTVELPPGRYLVSNSNPGAVSWDNRRAVYVRYSGVHIKGAGRGATVVALADGANAHVFKFGSRVTETVTVSDCSLSDLTIEGNRANQAVPTDTEDHNGGVDVVSGCERIHLARLNIADTMYYGIGFQRNGIKGCVVEDVEIENTGGDGIDAKDDSDTATGNSIRNVRVRNFGLLAGLLTGQAGIDLRSGWYAENIDVQDMTGALATNGIRLQNGTPGATPVQPTRVRGFRVAGNNVAGSVGARVMTRYGGLADGYIKACGDGYSLSDPDNRFGQLTAESNGVGFRLWQNASAGVEADTACLMGLIARSNAQAGIVYDSVDEISIIGADVRNNGIGHDIRAGSTNVRVLGGSCSGNTTNVSDNGTSTVIQNVSGYRTRNVVEGTGAIDSTGLKTVTIAHGLPFTPNINDVTVHFKRNTNVGDWVCGYLNVVSVDAANVAAQFRVTTASATAGALVTVVATINAKALA